VRDLKLEIQELKQAQAVVEAANAGARSTQAAVQALMSRRVVGFPEAGSH